METNVTEFITDLDGGIFEQKLSHAISQVAAGVIEHNKAGKISLTFDLKRIGDSHQVAVNHKLTFTQPTSKGKISEENTTKTPMHVGRGGVLSLFPEDQGQLFGKRPVNNTENTQA